MIAIHVNVSGAPTDVPQLLVDRGAAAAGDLSVPGRASFRLPDGTPPHGAVVMWAGRQVRTVIAIAVGAPLPPGDYEGGQLYEPIPTLEYAPARPRVVGITTTAEHFLMDGTRWIAALHSDFRLYHMWLAGEDSRGLCAQRRAAGSQGPRVFLSCGLLFALDPRTYGARFYTELAPFTRYLIDQGFTAWEATVYTDRQMTRLGDDHWPRTCEALAGQPGTIIELVNEYFKNGIDPRSFTPMANGVPQAAGSFSDGVDPPCPAWDYVPFHPRRDWKWPFTVAPTVNELREYPGQRAPILINEPIGADEVPQSGRRASDPSLFEKMAVDCALWAAGGVFHAQAGLMSEPWGPVQMACATAFFRGLQR